MDPLACIDLPAFPLQILLQRHPDWSEKPAAVVDVDKPQGLLLWVNEHARSFRILPGMRYAGGLSLCRELRAGVVEDSAIQSAIQRVERRLRFYSPAVESSGMEPGLFWADAGGLHLVHPSLERWAELIQNDLSAHGFEAEIAVGRTRFGSYAAAKCGARTGMGKGHKPGRPVVFASLQEEFETVRTIPIDRLAFDTDSRELLAKLGVATLGAFMALPPEAIQRRFKPEIHRLHQLARGDLWDPIQPSDVAYENRARRILDDPEMDRERLRFHCEDLLHQILIDLTRQQRSLAEIEVHLLLEHDGTGSRTSEGERKDSPRRKEALRPAEPTLDEEQLRELIALRLESLTLPAGVVEIELRVDSVPFANEQLQLLAATPKRDLGAVNRAFARLRAEFGDEVVSHACLKDGHLPEARFGWEPMKTIPIPHPRNVVTRPLVRRILDRPLPLPPRPRHEPDGWLITGVEGGSVEEILGPYVVSGGWWRRAVHREYHYARTDKGRWLWVYYDRERRRWFYQGEVE